MGIFICNHVYSSDKFTYDSEQNKLITKRSLLMPAGEEIHSKLFDDIDHDGFIIRSKRTGMEVVFKLYLAYPGDKRIKKFWIYEPIYMLPPGTGEQVFKSLSPELKNLIAIVQNDT